MILTKIVVSSDLSIVKKYMKELNDVNLNNIISSRLLQSKFYLKILDISYFIDDTNLSIILDIIERVYELWHFSVQELWKVGACYVCMLYT